jgi:hypothetical protein
VRGKRKGAEAPKFSLDGKEYASGLRGNDARVIVNER